METQKLAILRYLRSGRSITSIDALMMFRCFRLAARIKDLRDEGHRIDTIREHIHTNKTIARYKLIKEADA